MRRTSIKIQINGVNVAASDFICTMNLIGRECLRPDATLEDDEKWYDDCGDCVFCEVQDTCAVGKINE